MIAPKVEVVAAIRGPEGKSQLGGEQVIAVACAVEAVSTVGPAPVKTVGYAALTHDNGVRSPVLNFGDADAPAGKQDSVLRLRGRTHHTQVICATVMAIDGVRVPDLASVRVVWT